MGDRTRRVLVGVLVFVMLGSLLSQSVASQSMVNTEITGAHAIAKVTKAHVQLTLLEKSKTSTIVEVNNVLISLKSNKELTEASLEIKDFKTGETYLLEYRVSGNNGKYTVEVYSKEKILNRYNSQYNPLDPEVTKKLLSGNSGSVGIFSHSYRQYYWWDGVRFVKGYGVKYPHPHYEYYGIERWDTKSINGNQLIHYHLSDWISGILANLPPAIVGAVIGALVGGGIGAVVGAILAVIVASTTSYVLLDEEGCIWFWYAKEWEWKLFLLPPLVFQFQRVPKYFRVASYTLWDDLGIGNP